MKPDEIKEIQALLQRGALNQVRVILSNWENRMKISSSDLLSWTQRTTAAFRRARVG